MPKEPRSADTAPGNREDRRAGQRQAASPDAAVNKNVRSVSTVEQGALRRRSSIESVSDAISRGGGSAPSLIVHGIVFGGWLLVNTHTIHGVPAFDPFPFGLLTTIVSLEAIFLSLFILISQNRLSRHTEQREHLDLQINLLAEQESTATLQLLRRLCEHLSADLGKVDQETRHLEKKTNIHDLVAEIDRNVPTE